MTFTSPGLAGEVASEAKREGAPLSTSRVRGRRGPHPASPASGGGEERSARLRAVRPLARQQFVGVEPPAPQRLHRNSAADAFTIEQPDEVVDAGDGLAVEPHDDV